MPKKKTPDDISAPPAPVRRRAPARKPAETAADSKPGNGRPEPTQAEIAEAAYFRHLNRGGHEGDELNDWIEAERELRRRHSR